MRAILLPILPENCVKTLNGEKTIEIKKNAPKDWIQYLSGKTKRKPEPRTVYICCTNDETSTLERSANEPFHFFIVDDKKHLVFKLDKKHTGYNGKVVAKFMLRKVENILPVDPFDCDIENRSIDPNELVRLSCLTAREIMRYLDVGKGYAWHIDDLVIFDKPKELSDFLHYRKRDSLPHERQWRLESFKPVKVTKALSTWIYVEARE